MHKTGCNVTLRSGKIARPDARATFLKSIPRPVRLTRRRLFNDDIRHPRIGADRPRIKERPIVDLVRSAPKDFLAFGFRGRCRSTVNDSEHNWNVLVAMHTVRDKKWNNNDVWRGR